ncbi:hypothetical protein F443_10555 [Phytophthora nicotianae P1569]|uniref:Uncharacterized protein n=2 Tax=Phytophthora nicotianae TaxID=4792 RepID=V9F147_PHYNI|nr:hypothetical protein F443_10555 [Phytophthora nicotianae P1569]ETO73411.1 hypothetical protein F444_10654 [Phytophthora nicotianae P1976]
MSERALRQKPGMLLILPCRRSRLNSDQALALAFALPALFFPLCGNPVAWLECRKDGYGTSRTKIYRETKRIMGQPLSKVMHELPFQTVDLWLC